jgi:hypothetical protein
MKWTEQKKKRLLGKHDKRCEATRKTETRITERENGLSDIIHRAVHGAVEVSSTEKAARRSRCPAKKLN